ncbi:hypothetical protein RCF27_09200 [Rhodococcus pyridinivorans]|uniref:hypothetical protein n=1 Tax=Rhodococcus pyridinivorans TaxID=103816 RepID=UPI00280A7930|nr:hypothetical protein [Rhodococcus pyridinivorans]WMM74434.1 hypothetical protein RCF27_09200 [Rhodococcus pyridinivorans]
MPAKNSQPLTEAKFNAVIRALKKDPKGLEAIAAKQGLKPSTVRTIRQAKTWEEYERRKSVKVEQQNERRKTNTAVQESIAPIANTKQGVAKASDIKGVPVTPSPLIPSAPLTREELRTEVKAAAELLTLNFETRQDRIEAKADRALKEIEEISVQQVIDQARKERKPFWRFW